MHLTTSIDKMLCFAGARDSQLLAQALPKLPNRTYFRSLRMTYIKVVHDLKYSDSEEAKQLKKKSPNFLNITS